jgi:hypothetical protein
MECCITMHMLYCGAAVAAVSGVALWLVRGGGAFARQQPVDEFCTPLPKPCVDKPGNEHAWLHTLWHLRSRVSCCVMPGWRAVQRQGRVGGMLSPYEARCVVVCSRQKSNESMCSSRHVTATRATIKCCECSALPACRTAAQMRPGPRMGPGLCVQACMCTATIRKTRCPVLCCPPNPNPYHIVHCIAK